MNQASHHPTDWFCNARWGVNIAFMAIEGESTGGADIPAEKWNKQVDAFDVEALAKQLGNLGAPYCFLTLGQNSGHYCSPNATYDEFVGINPSKCSRRDLVADFAAALRRYGIRLLVYLPSGGPAADPVAKERLGWEWGYETPWPGGWCDNLRNGLRLEAFQLKWEAVISEWSRRWGQDVWGWWIDGCYFADEMYRHPKAPNFKSFAGALRAGNERALVAFNPGQIVPLICHSEEEDYTAGEVDKQFPLCPGRWVERNKHAAQWHVYTWIGAQWGRGMTPRLRTEFVVGYTKQTAAHQGVVTWDVPFHRNGTIPDHFLKILDTLAKAVPPEKPLCALP